MANIQETNKELAALLGRMQQRPPGKDDAPAGNRGFKATSVEPETAMGTQTGGGAGQSSDKTISMPVGMAEGLAAASAQRSQDSVDVSAEVDAAFAEMEEEAATTEVKMPSPVERRAKALMEEDPSLNADDAQKQAKKDVERAGMILTMYRELKESGKGPDTIENKVARVLVIRTGQLVDAGVSESDAPMQAVVEYQAAAKNRKAAAARPTQAPEPTQTPAAEPVAAPEPTQTPAPEPTQAPAEATEPAAAPAEAVEPPKAAEPAPAGETPKETIEQTVTRILDAKLELFGGALDRAMERLRTELSGGSGNVDVEGVVEGKLRVFSDFLERQLFNPMKAALVAALGENYEGAAGVGELRTETATRLLVKALGAESYKDEVQKVRDVYGTKTVDGILGSFSGDGALVRAELAITFCNCEPEALEAPNMQEHKKWVDAQSAIIMNRAQECRGGDA